MGGVLNTLLLVMISLSVLLQRLDIARLRKRLAALAARGEARPGVEDAGLKYVPYANVPATVVTALQSGNKIQAIKLYRDATGADLKEAKGPSRKSWQPALHTKQSRWDLESHCDHLGLMRISTLRK